MIKIVIDTSADYTLEEIKERDFSLVPMTVFLNGQTYIEGVNLERDDFYEMLETSVEFPKTAQPSPQKFLDVFEEAKANGDSVICILLSSKLSGTCQSAHLAKDMAEYDDIYIIDSLSAASGIKLMADYARKLANEGLSACEIAQKVEAMKSRVTILAGLDTLEYLYKGGRLSKASAIIGAAAHIKPIITVKDGAVEVIGKAIGKAKATANIISHLQNLEMDPDFPVYSVYSFGTENCEKLESKLTSNGYPIDERKQIGSTIGAHTGPGVFGVIFVAK